MSKGKWGKALALGGLLALGIWLLWQMGLALLTVKSVLSEDALIPGQWAGAFLAAFTKRKKLSETEIAEVQDIIRRMGGQ